MRVTFLTHPALLQMFAIDLVLDNFQQQCLVLSKHFQTYKTWFLLDLNERCQSGLDPMKIRVFQENFSLILSKQFFFQTILNWLEKWLSKETILFVSTKNLKIFAFYQFHLSQTAQQRFLTQTSFW